MSGGARLLRARRQPTSCGLQMSAVRGGDEYVLNGSKIWTTLAQWADMIFCLVRTSKEGKPRGRHQLHRLLHEAARHHRPPAAHPRRPRRGKHEISQVFFENVRVPIKDPIGKENEGWTTRNTCSSSSAAMPTPRPAPHAAQDTEGRLRSRRQRAGHPQSGFRPQARLMEMQIGIDMTERRVLGPLAGQNVGGSSMLKCRGSGAAGNELTLEAHALYSQPFVQDTVARRGRANDTRPPPRMRSPPRRATSTTARPRSMRAPTKSSTTFSPSWFSVSDALIHSNPGTPR